MPALPPDHPLRRLREAGRMLRICGILCIGFIAAGAILVLATLESVRLAPLVLPFAAIGIGFAAMMIWFANAIATGQRYGLTGGLVATALLLALALLNTLGAVVLAMADPDAWATDPIMWISRALGLGVLVYVIIRLARLYPVVNALRNPWRQAARGFEVLPPARGSSAQQPLTMPPPPPARH